MIGEGGSIYTSTFIKNESNIWFISSIYTKHKVSPKDFPLICNKFFSYIIDASTTVGLENLIYKLSPLIFSGKLLP